MSPRSSLADSLFILLSKTTVRQEDSKMKTPARVEIVKTSLDSLGCKAKAVFPSPEGQGNMGKAGLEQNKESIGRE